MRNAVMLPEKMAVVQAEYPNMTVKHVFQITRAITEEPDPLLGIVGINVYIAETLDSEQYELLTKLSYEQGQPEFTFISGIAGFFKITFVDGDDNESTMSNPFAVESTYDLDLEFSLEEDSKSFVAGDVRYLTVSVRDKENKISVVPASHMQVLGPFDGSTAPVLHDYAMALSDKLTIKSLLDTTALAPGDYFANVKVFTGYEVIQNKRPMKFKITAR
jgi:hypothetical protein